MHARKIFRASVLRRRLVPPDLVADPVAAVGGILPGPDPRPHHLMIAIQNEYCEAFGRAGNAGQTHPESGPLERLFDAAAAPNGSVSVRRNRTLVREGDRADTVFLVESGVLRSSKLLPDGRRQVVSFHEEGDLVGLLEGEVHVFSLEGVTSVRLRAANRVRVQVLLERQPDWRDHVLAWAARELAEARNRAVMLGRQNAHERVSSFLLHKARDGREAELRMSRRDMADYLGLTAETVSRLLTEMESTGRIRRISPHRIEIADLSGLAVPPGSSS